MICNKTNGTKTDAFAERMMAMDGGETMLEAPNLGPVGDTICSNN